MELKKTKQPIMGLAALLIVLFHLFPASRSNDVLSSVVRYIVMTGYIGVDIFFFMTGYMAHFSKTDNYFQYIKRKFLNIYPIFIFSCILFVIMGKLSIKKALYTVLGADLFLSGGGSFLWFIPAIMIFYLLVPFYKKLIKKIGSAQTFVVSVIVWAALVFALENILTNHSVNIFLCKGDYYVGSRNQRTKRNRGYQGEDCNRYRKRTFGGICNTYYDCTDGRVGIYERK